MKPLDGDKNNTISNAADFGALRKGQRATRLETQNEATGSLEQIKGIKCRIIRYVHRFHT